MYRTHTDIDPYSDLSFGNDDNVKDKRRPLTPFDRRSTSFNHMTNSLMRSVWAPARVSNDNWRTSGRSKSAKSRQFAADNEDDASKRNWDIAMKVWG